MAKDITCTCGHSWNKSDSSKKDMNVCHICGKDNTMKDGGWLDKYQPGGSVAKKDATTQAKPGPVFLGNPYAKEMAKRQTSIGAYDANKKASPAMQQVFAEKADTQAKKKRIRDILEKGQDVLGKAELLSFIPTPFTQGVGASAGVTNAAISAVLAGQDFSEGNYAGALGNFGAGALGVGAGYTGIRGGLTNVINDLSPTKGPKNFMTGQSMSSTPGTLGTLKPLEPHQEIGMHAIGDLDYVSDRELKEAYEEALDKFQLTNYKPNIDPFLDHDLEKALALDMRMKFADRLPKFTDSKYTSAVHAEDPFFFDARGPYSERFFNQQRYDLSKLNPQDRTLMDAYQHGYDAYFNNRSTLNSIPTNLKNYFGELSDQFNTAVQKNKITKDVTLNRSVGDYVLDYWDPVENKSIGRGLRSELQAGDVYKDQGFMSTSLPHYNYSGGKYTDKIIVPGGGVQSYAFPNSTSYGQFMNEQEVILPKGLIRRVEDVPEPGKVVTSILNPYKNGGWLDKYNDGGPVQPNYNDASVSMSKDFVGDGYSNVGRNYSPAWGGQFQDGGTLKDNAERALALGSVATPFPLNYGLSLAGSAIDLYDAYNAKTPHDRNVQLTEAALGVIPYGRIVKGMKLGTDAYKAYKALKPLAAINFVIDVKDTVDPNLKYAMGGSMPGAVGFTYARTIGPPAPSNGKYAKKTLPSAQDGTQIKTNIPVPIDEIKKANASAEAFNKQYVQSPNYLSLLQKQGYAPEEIKKRQDSVLGMTNDDYTYTNFGPNYVYDDDETGKTKINYNQGGLGDWSNFGDIAAHEWGHVGVTRFGEDALKPAEQYMLTSRLNMKNVSDDEGAAEHDMAPQENRADLVELRKALQDRKIYDSFKGGKFKQKHLNELRNFKGDQDEYWNRSMRLYKDKDIIKLMNTIASNDPQQGMPMAQNGMEMKYYQEGLDFRPKTISKDGGWLSKYEEGGVIQDDMGQYNHPGEITQIGSNQITMQGVPYPVLGISDTGDMQMMYPNQEYQYDGESVTEYPMMKEGGALQLVKLDQLTNFTNYNPTKPSGWLEKYQ